MEDWSQNIASLRAALTATFAALMALPKEGLLSPFLNRMRVMELTAPLTKTVQLVEERFVTIYTPSHRELIMEALGKLGGYGQAYYQAEMDVDSAWVPAKLARKQELTDILGDRDQTLLAWVKPAVRKNPDGLKRLALITPGSGLRDDAEDVLDLAEMCRDYNIRNDEITDTFLDESEEMATEQIKLMADLDVNVVGSPADIRRRAFTLWYNNYNLVINAARYAASVPPPVDAQFPGAHAERAKSAQPAPQGTNVTQGNPPTTNPGP